MGNENSQRAVGGLTLVVMSYMGHRWMLLYFNTSKSYFDLWQNGNLHEADNEHQCHSVSERTPTCNFLQGELLYFVHRVMQWVNCKRDVASKSAK